VTARAAVVTVPAVDVTVPAVVGPARALATTARAVAETPVRRHDRAVRRPHAAGGRGAVADRGAVTDRGSVTVELAVGLVGVVVLLGLVLLLTTAATTQLRCTEAARAGARSAALGEDDAAVLGVVRRSAGDGAGVAVVRADGWVTVTVDRPVTGAWGLGGLEARASSSTPAEP